MYVAILLMLHCIATVYPDGVHAHDASVCMHHIAYSYKL